MNGTSNPGRVCQLGLAVGSKEEPANSVFSTTYKRNYLNFRPML